MEFDIWQKLTVIFILEGFILVAINPILGGIWFSAVILIMGIINNRDS